MITETPVPPNNFNMNAEVFRRFIVKWQTAAEYGCLWAEERRD